MAGPPPDYSSLLESLAPALGAGGAPGGGPPGGMPPPGGQPPPAAAPILPMPGARTGLAAPAGALGPTPQQLFDKQQHEFVSAAVKDFLGGNIGREDLHKATGYLGVEPYEEWKHNNVRRLKAASKSEGK